MENKNIKEISERNSLKIVRESFEIENKQEDCYKNVTIKNKALGRVIKEVLIQGNIFKDKFRKSGKSFDSYVVSDLGNYLAASHISNDYKEEKTRFNPNFGILGGWESRYTVNFEIFDKEDEANFLERITFLKYPGKNYYFGHPLGEGKVLLKGTRFIVSKPILKLEQRKIESYGFSGGEGNNYYSVKDLIKSNKRGIYSDLSLKDFIDSTICNYKGLPEIFDNAIKNAKY